MTEGSSREAAVDDLLGLLSEVDNACGAAGRDDLAQRVASRRALVAEPFVAVVVAGEYKTGKSSLVNALIGADLCPVDEDHATAVPTIVRYAPEASVWVRREAEDAAESSATPPERVPIEALASYASEAANPGNREQVQAIEVGLPSPLLRDGLVLVDTPGVGGLVSQYTVATLASLSMAHAALFLSDAMQEYTASEIEFLTAARQTCPEVVPVLTKVDIVPEWGKIQELDQLWLQRAGVDATVVPVSAALSLHGIRRRRSDLEQESGLAVLVERLAQVLHNGRRITAIEALSEVHAVTAQLAAPLRAERDALADPSAVIGELERAEEQGSRLASDRAEWISILDDGLSDLEDEVEVEVASRMRAVKNEAEHTVMTTDPASRWDEFDAALARQVSSEMSAISTLLLGGAQRIAERIAEHFTAHEASIAPSLQPSLTRTLSADATLGFGGAAKFEWRGVLLEAGWGGLEGLAAIGSILTFTTISLFNPFSLVVGVFIGGKSLRQARRRELERRRQQALEAVSRYLDDAGRAADRQWRSSLRRIRRELRSAYQQRADGLYRSAQESLAAARRNVAADDRDRVERLDRVAALLASLRALENRAEQLVSAFENGQS